MAYLFLIATVLLISGQDVLRKQCDKKHEPNPFLFTALSAAAALVFYLVSAGFRLELTWTLVPYSALFGVSFGTALLGAYLTAKHGSVSICALTEAYSLAIPTLYGVVVYSDPIGIVGIVGLLLLVTSILLVNLQSEKVHISGKCLLSMALLFFGNGICSTVMKVQQTDFAGAYKNEFMILALALATVSFLVLGLRKQKQVGTQLKNMVLYAVPCGLLNALSNFFVMLLTGLVPNSVLFPTVSAGGIVMGFLLATFLYREKLTARQLVGYAMGAIAAVLLNL